MHENPQLSPSLRPCPADSQSWRAGSLTRGPAVSCLTCPSSMTAATGARPTPALCKETKEDKEESWGDKEPEPGAQAPASREVWEGRPAWHPKPDPAASASSRATDLLLAVHLWGHNTVSPSSDEAAQVANPAPSPRCPGADTVLPATEGCTRVAAGLRSAASASLRKKPLRSPSKQGRAWGWV